METEDAGIEKLFIIASLSGTNLIFKFLSLHFNSSSLLLMEIKFIIFVTNFEDPFIQFKQIYRLHSLGCWCLVFFLGGGLVVVLFWFFFCGNATFFTNMKHSKCFVTLSTRHYVSLSCSLCNAGLLPYSL